MKQKLFFLGLMLTIAGSVFSQNCKYEQNDIDKFTNKMTKVTKKVKVIETFNSEGYMSLSKIDTSFSVFLSYRTSFSDKVTVDEGAELSFLLENGKVITIKKNKMNYDITKGQLDEIIKSKTKALRYYYTDNASSYKYTDIEIKSKNAEDIINLIKCIY